ncbi:hypothetical protein BUALT_Bualt02G0090600 [Buddleja alternifolia]|uniref:Uncharacterized protein n=1 Tax=Buddleja alternifolia TaxID=168488 RepID=A0AAV6Y2W4_9LAMI|nr:hypothetical protein BUALT_Bualt02G0090600 [Buddleja alternifolia]
MVADAQKIDTEDILNISIKNNSPYPKSESLVQAKEDDNNIDLVLSNKYASLIEKIWEVRIALGDFNEIVDGSEVSGGNESEGASSELQWCLISVDLSTVPMHGNLFSWSNKRRGEAAIWKRLDRVVANPSWLIKYPNVSYQCANPRTSDHIPLVLLSEPCNGKSGNIFQFDNFLLEDSELMPLINNIWKHNIVGVPIYAVIHKLKALKPLIKDLRRK